MSRFRSLSLLLASTFLFLTACNNRTESASDTKGTWSTKYYADEYVLINKPLATSTIISLMRSSNPNRQDAEMSDEKLANTILEAAKAFKIDPRVLVGIIHHESNFNRQAVSKTGAVGFMQFTTTAINEINDQLGKRGTDYARKAAIDYLNGVLPDLYTRLSGKPYVHLWKKGDMKAALKSDGVLNVIYGAALLKLYLAGEKEKRPTASASSWYTSGLETYNGEARRVQYRIDVLRTANGLQ